MAIEKFTIGELANISNISRRTVRYYVQLGLIEPPLGAGRGHYYTLSHVEELKKIRHLQEMGLMLEEIREKLRPSSKELSVEVQPSFLVSPELWLKIPVFDGFEIHLKSGLFRPTAARIAKLRKAAREIFGSSTIENFNQEGANDNE